MGTVKVYKLECSVRQADMLLKNLEQSEKGFGRNELKMLDRVADKIEKQTKPFADQHKQLVEDAQEMTLDRMPGEQAAVNAKYKEDADLLNTGTGGEKCDFLFDNEEWKFVKTTWESRGKFRGDREVRKLVLQIVAAVDGAREVELGEDGLVEEVEDKDSKTKVESK